jgi:hypothetical protein
MLEIKLDQQDACFAPGNTIAGLVTWQPLPENTTGLDIRLIWYTQGKGDMDVSIAASHEVVIADRQVAGEARFEFIAHHRPFSFAGKLIELTWAIELLQKPSLDSVSTSLIIHPNKQKIELDKSFNDSLSKRAKRKFNVTLER